ncbi:MULTISPECIES: hypothetical protein [unclassified Thioalkalivibrio]|uniref:hypothetical protein n=1 Tax=unclassified Thioalkalivibrio TaxID=2621013 RepID=UPI0003777440
MRPLPEPADRIPLAGIGDLVLECLIHEYPGKRRIFRATLNGSDPVVAKFYLGSIQQWPEWRRGVRGALRLQSAGIAAPALRHAGFAKRYRAWLCVLDWIEADEPWPPEALPEQLHHLLLRTLAEHHQAGLRQHDLNWLNFIPHDRKLYAIDGDRVHWQRRALNRRKARAHLLRLYASKSRLPESEVAGGYAYYCRLREWPCTEDDIQAFVQAVRIARLRQAKKVAARASQGWKHYPRKRYGHIRTIRDRRHLEADTVECLAKALHAKGTTDGYPDPDTIRACRIDLPAGPMPSLLRPWVTRQLALRTWRHALILQRLGMPVLRPLAITWSNDGLGWLIQRNPPGLRPLSARTEQPHEAQDGGTILEQADRSWGELAKAGLALSLDSPETLGWDGERVWFMDPQGLNFGRPDSPQLRQSVERAVRALRARLNPNVPESGP